MSRSIRNARWTCLSHDSAISEGPRRRLSMLTTAYRPVFNRRLRIYVCFHVNHTPTCVSFLTIDPLDSSCFLRRSTVLDTLQYITDISTRVSGSTLIPGHVLLQLCRCPRRRCVCPRKSRYCSSRSDSGQQTICAGRTRQGVFLPRMLRRAQGCVSHYPFLQRLLYVIGGKNALNHDITASLRSVTLESCVAGCAAQNYKLAGVMNGNTCACDNSISSRAPKLDDKECSSSCTGNAGEICGGYVFVLFVTLTLIPHAIEYGITASIIPTSLYPRTHRQLFAHESAYRLGALPIPTVPATIGKGLESYVHLGCFVDRVQYRTLGGTSLTSANMTPAICTKFCHEHKYRVAGLEHGNECWCATHIVAPELASSSSECGQACSGDSTSICGDDDRINVYGGVDDPDVLAPKILVGTNLLNQYLSVGCYSDSYEKRLLSGSSFEAEDMTATKCAYVLSFAQEEISDN